MIGQVTYVASSTRYVAWATAPSTVHAYGACPLGHQPRRVMVAGHLEVEAGFLGGDGIIHELPGAALLGHQGVAEPHCSLPMLASPVTRRNRAWTSPVT